MSEPFDLRTVGDGHVIGPAKQQGNSRQCIAYALVATVEGRIGYRDRYSLQLDADSYVDLELDDFLERVGRSESVRKHRNTAEKHGLALPGHGRVFPRFRNLRGVARMQESLHENGPLLVAMELYPNFDDFTGAGFYEPAGRRLPRGHAACVVGYVGEPRDTDGHWILKNSYGAGWGDQGFFRVRYRLDPLTIQNSAYEVVSVHAEVNE